MNTFSALDLFLYSGVAYTQQLNWLESKSKGHVRSGGLPLGRGFNPADSVSSTPSRTSFILHRLLVAILCYICLFLLFGRAEDFPDLFVNNVLNEWKLSSATLPSRIYLLASCIIGVHAAQKARYNTHSILAVLTGLSDSTDLGPFQGSYAGTYSTFVTFTCLRLKPRTLAARYSRFFTSFALSGLIHVFVDEALGIPKSQSNAFFFLTIQPVAFAVEEIAQKISEHYGILHQESDEEIRRLIGYIWVGVWGTLT
ncbi:uncharacterized protein BDV17DRAFT_288853 [Aspergillus undulatus]|uniref:uncharacterized protein n=1 Tax=Aspergillus undulatus TaxID=1810928 RepID=UPI003CCCDE6D